jgi:hypothetical protein
MSNGWRLILKDIRLHWLAFFVLLTLQIATFITFELQFPPYMQSLGAVFIQGTASIGTFVMAYRITASEEANNTLRFLKSLPVTTTEIFGAKFVFIALYCLANLTLLNVFLVVFGPLLPWEDMDPATNEVLAIGVVVQLAFGTLLVAVAALLNSEKAIWLPFPLVIILLNVYTQLTSEDGPVDTTDFWSFFSDNWVWLSLLVVAVLVIITVITIRVLRTKRSLI